MQEAEEISDIIMMEIGEVSSYEVTSFGVPDLFEPKWSVHSFMLFHFDYYSCSFVSKV